MKRLLVAVGAALVASTLWSPSLSAQTLVDSGAVTNRVGAVTVEAKYLGTETVTAGETLKFELNLNTHSVNLDQYDLKQLATLRNDRGVAVKPLRFERNGSGHHVQNVLVFPAKDKAGAPVVGGSAKAVELVLFDVANVPERILRWDVR